MQQSNCRCIVIFTMQQPYHHPTIKFMQLSNWRLMVIVLISSSLSLTSHHMCSSPLQQSQHHATIKSMSFCHHQLSLMQQSSPIYERNNNQLRPIIIIIIQHHHHATTHRRIVITTSSQQLNHHHRHHHCIITINLSSYCHSHWHDHHHDHDATNHHSIVIANRHCIATIKSPSSLHRCNNQLVVVLSS